MSLFHFLRRSSAPIARERLQILITHERSTRSQPDLLAVLREESLAVIGRHVSFEPDNVQIKVSRDKSISTLAVDIEIPNGGRALDVLSPQSRSTFSPRLDYNASRTDQWVI
jgi:cell division topological specificity factor